MKIEIVNDRKYNWINKKIGTFNIFFKGIIWLNKKYYTGENACRKLSGIFNSKVTSTSSNQKETIRDLIKKFSGHFAFVINSSEIVIAVVDKVRSYPIYYYKSENVFYVSNSAVKLKEEAHLTEIDAESLLIYKMAGYCIGQDTIYKDLKQIQPGRFILLDDKSNEFYYTSYFKYWVDKTVNSSEEELLDELHTETLKTFSKMVETLNGDPVWLPLSGGYDSRLILSMLKELKYDNIITYTYGLKGVWEIKRAKYIAEHLNTKWHYIQFKPKQTKAYFYKNDTQNYFSFAGGLNSAPHLAEYYALLELRKKKLMPDNAIIINGQSGDFTSGGHIPKILVETNVEELNIDLFMQAVIDKHYSLWIDFKSEENKLIISEKILKLLQLSNIKKISKDSFAKYFELHEWEERQSKFVVNGQRAYDWFGYGWRLPLWSDELMEFWMKVPWKAKFGQHLLIKYLEKHNPGSVFNNIQLPPQFSYYPLWAKLLKPIISIANKVSNNNVNYQQRYLQYFMTYAPYYPQRKYSDFLKDSQWHRNPVSYWSQYMLKELKNENSFHH